MARSSSRRRPSRSHRRSNRSNSPSRRREDEFRGELTPRGPKQPAKEKKKRKASRSPSPRRLQFSQGLSPGDPNFPPTPDKLLEFRASTATPIRDITSHFDSWLSQAHLPVQTSLVEAVMERLISIGVGSISQFSSTDPVELEKSFLDPNEGSNRGLASQAEAVSVARRLRELSVRTADKAWNSVPLSGQEAGSVNQGWEVVANSLSKILESRKKAKSAIMDADHSDDEAPRPRQVSLGMALNSGRLNSPVRRQLPGLLQDCETG